MPTLGQQEMGHLTVVMGGAFTGKSAFAESRFPTGARVAYLATLQPADDDMKNRVAQIRQKRPPLWTTFDAPLQVPQVLRQCGYQYDGFLVDSINHYIWNLLVAVGRQRDDNQLMVEMDRTLGAIELARGAVVVITSEAGAGGFAGDPGTRRYQTLVGRANAGLLEKADEAHVLYGGVAQRLK
jgi:adenosylcobinamide kinase/adenosylcobinamide-phosphate guanylyltransferase